MRTCVLSVELLLNAFPQWLHLCGFSCDVKGTLKKKTESTRPPTGNGARCTRRAYLRVDDFVSAERAGLAEAFPTHLTHEGPGPGVHRHVPCQVVVRIKNLQRNKGHLNHNN